MERLRKVNSRVPAQRGTTDQAALDTRSAPVPASARQGAVDRVRWPWLLSDLGILTAVLFVAGVGVAALVGMWLIAGDVAGAERAKLQIEALKYGLGFIAAAGAVAALLLGVRRQRLSEHTHHLELRKQDHTERQVERSRELELRKQEHAEVDAAERRVTDLYGKAVEQLGHADAAVRLGGLYALERVAQNNPRQRQTIVNVLCAYLRMPYTPPTATRAEPASDPVVAGLPLPAPRPAAAEGRNPHQELQVRLTAQRILTNHLRLPAEATSEQAPQLAADPGLSFWPAMDLDLTGAHLVNWDLARGRVRNFRASRVTFHEGIWFGHATFTGDARFDEATFAGDAWFERATFSGHAGFGATTFTGHAEFGWATFAEDARFEEATFAQDARFEKANFSGNVWWGEPPSIGGVWFCGATFAQDARFDEATFDQGVWFERATFKLVPTFNESRVSFRDDSRDAWPPGWAVVRYPESLGFGGLVYTPAEGQAGAAAAP